MAFHGCALAAVLVAATMLAAPFALADEAELRVRSGSFTVTKYADVAYARSLVSTKVGEATITYVGSRKGWGFSVEDVSSVWALVDADSDGSVDSTVELVADMRTPSGIALRADALFITGYDDDGQPDSVKRGAVWRLDDVHTKALEGASLTVGDLELVTNELPGDRWHGWRDIVFTPAGKLLITVGINCNSCPVNTTREGYEFATIYELDVDASPVAKRLVARGVRNSVGLTIHPDQPDWLYFTDNGRDEWGAASNNTNATDNTPDCELNRVRLSAAAPTNFGFPLCSSGGRGNPWLRQPGPGVPLNDPDLNRGGRVKDCTARGAFEQPLAILGPHVAPIGLKFYKWQPGFNLPRAWNNRLFIVERGSWNRRVPIGYRITWLAMDAETGAVTRRGTFMDGWLNRATAESWGRPADVEFTPDGHLLVSDDTSGAVFKVSHMTSRGR